MSVSVWRVAGLDPALQKVYTKLCQGRRLVSFGRKRLVVYTGQLDGLTDGIVGLIGLGLAEKRKIGKRTIVALGTWDLVERRFAGAREVSTILTVEMEELLERYSADQQRMIERAFIAFGSLRKGGKVSPSLLLRQLETYSKYAPEAVVEGLRIYLEGDYVERGVGERYALGIMRGVNRGLAQRGTETATVEKTSQTDKSDKLAQRQAAQRELERLVDKKVEELAYERYSQHVSLATLPVHVLVELRSVAKKLIAGGEA